MEPTASDDVTLLLAGWRDGTPGAESKLMETVQRELRKIAAAYLRRERPTGTIMAPTELVNDAYLRLIGRRQISWENRAHFYGIAAQIMRRILVDHARRRRAQKRNAVDGQLSVADLEGSSGQGAVDVLDLHEALTELAALDARQAEIVALRYFGGLTVEEIAETQRISPATVKRDLLTAKLWLRRRLQP